MLKNNAEAQGVVGEGEQKMNQQNRSDPWEGVKGLPPAVRKIRRRTLPGKERFWVVTLSEMRGLAFWLCVEQMSELENSLDPTFSKDIFNMLREEDVGAYNMWHHIFEKVHRSADECFAVHELFLRLVEELHDELKDALGASRLCPDE